MNRRLRRPNLWGNMAKERRKKLRMWAVVDRKGDLARSYFSDRPKIYYYREEARISKKEHYPATIGYKVIPAEVVYKMRGGEE